MAKAFASHVHVRDLVPVHIHGLVHGQPHEQCHGHVPGHAKDRGRDRGRAPLRLYTGFFTACYAGKAAKGGNAARRRWEGGRGKGEEERGKRKGGRGKGKREGGRGGTKVFRRLDSFGGVGRDPSEISPESVFD